MCARYTLTSPILELEEEFEADLLPGFGMDGPRYNVAPTQDVMVVVESDRNRCLRPMKWGLIPAWAKDRSIGTQMINARSESVREKPAYRNLVRKQRCLIPTNGFFEWTDHRVPVSVAAQASLFDEPANAPTKVIRQPFLIHLNDQEVFALAGLWDTWKAEEGEWIHSFTVLTTEPNDLVGKLHDRMPVIVRREDYSTWLDSRNHVSESLTELYQPFPSSGMAMHPVTTRMSNPRLDEPAFIEEVPL
jgi:putative SOS response-associated peptidase YedK